MNHFNNFHWKLNKACCTLNIWWLHRGHTQIITHLWWDIKKNQKKNPTHTHTDHITRSLTAPLCQSRQWSALNVMRSIKNNFSLEKNYFTVRTIKLYLAQVEYIHSPYCHGSTCFIVVHCFLMITFGNMGLKVECSELIHALFGLRGLWRLQFRLWFLKDTRKKKKHLVVTVLGISGVTWVDTTHLRLLLEFLQHPGLQRLQISGSLVLNCLLIRLEKLEPRQNTIFFSLNEL